MVHAWPIIYVGQLTKLPIQGVNSINGMAIARRHGGFQFSETRLTSLEWSHHVYGLYGTNALL